MIDISLGAGKIQCLIDTRIYTDTTIAKWVYSLSGRFVVFQSNVDPNTRKVLLEPSGWELSAENLEQTKRELCQHLNDYKLREIVNQETKDIRTILYIKAFANSSEFEDFNLLP